MRQKGLKYLVILGVLLFGTLARGFAGTLNVDPAQVNSNPHLVFSEENNAADALHFKYISQFSFEQGSHFFIEEQLEEETEEEVSGQSQQHLAALLPASFQHIFHLVHLQENQAKQEYDSAGFFAKHVSRCILFRVFRI